MMLPFTAGKRWIARRLPPLILLLALATLFAGDDHRGLFYRPGQHNFNSTHGMALAAHLSPDSHFLTFHRRVVSAADGSVVPIPYSSWPPWSFALVRAAILPFPDDLSSQIYAARVLMLLFFSASALLAYLALARLFASRWVALAAALLAFSTPYLLFYADMVFVEQPALFGMLLAFHGMVVFEQEGRFRQLLLKTAFAVLMGWQVFALLLPFVVLGLARESWRSLRSPPRHRALIAPLTSRYLRLGFFSLVLGLAVLSHSLFLDYRYANRGEATSVTELRTLRKAAFRAGMAAEYSPYTEALMAWRNVLPEEFARLGRSLVPLWIHEWQPHPQVPLPEEAPRSLFAVAAGAAALAACLAGLAFVRYRMLVAALALCGFFWSLPLRQHASIHDFDALFYAGVPLICFSLLLLGLRRWFGERPVVGLAAIAAGGFGLAVHGQSPDPAATELAAVDIADFETIRERTGSGDVVYLPTRETRPFGRDSHTTNFYLHGRTIEYTAPAYYGPLSRGYGEQGRTDITDFIVTPDRVDGPALLTPENRRFFLYRTADYERIHAELGAPVIESDWKVHLQDGHLIYTRCGCRLGPDENAGNFFVHVFPEAVGDLPAPRRRYGFGNLGFSTRHTDWRALRFSSGLCVLKRSLPDYAFTHIRTGEHVPGKGRLWEAGFAARQGVEGAADGTRTPGTRKGSVRVGCEASAWEDPPE